MIIGRRELLLGAGSATVTSAALAAARTARPGAATAEGQNGVRSDAETFEAAHPFNGPYRGGNLEQIAFPLGGIGAGMICLEGAGALSNVSLRHRPDLTREPGIFAALSIQGANPIARVLEGPVPVRKRRP